MLLAAIATHDAATASALATLVAQATGSGLHVLPTAPAEVYTPQVLTVGAGAAQLTIPAGANRAQVIVTAGSARMGLGDATTAPVYVVSEGLADLAGAQLAGLRLTRVGATDATVRVDYWRSA